MNTLVEKNIISEMTCGTNFSYVLNDNSIFLSIEYKVLQNQGNSCFVKCMKMMYNGKIQLLYQTKSLKPFLSLVPNIDPDKLVTVVTNLLSNIVEVKHNGFLSCQNIDIDLDKIFIDPTTLNVYFVYLPLSKKTYNDYSFFENGIRSSLIRFITSTPSLLSSNTSLLCDDLSDGTLSIETICSNLKGGKTIGVSEELVQNSKLRSSALRLVSMNSPDRIEFVINKDEYVIGKKANACDGVIEFNKMVSRSHCKISSKGNKYTVTDLQSANGTFVNKVRLMPNIPYPINNGDVIRMANSDFQVIIG